MTAKITYTKVGSDPTTIVWPQAGPPSDRFMLTTGTAKVIHELIGYPDGSIIYPDGRVLPPLTLQGSTITHGK